MRKFIPIIFMSLFLFGCGSTKYKVKVVKGEEFKLNSTLTVTGRDNHDPLGARGLFEFHLTSAGFNVVVEEVAETISQLDIKTTRSQTDKVKDLLAKGSKYKNLKSAYALKYNYSTRLDTGYGEVFSNLSASIYDLRTGKLVATTLYRTGSLSTISPDETIENIVQKLVAQGIQ